MLVVGSIRATQFHGSISSPAGRFRARDKSFLGIWAVAGSHCGRSSYVECLLIGVRIFGQHIEAGVRASSLKPREWWVYGVRYRLNASVECAGPYRIALRESLAVLKGGTAEAAVDGGCELSTTAQGHHIFERAEATRFEGGATAQREQTESPGSHSTLRGYSLCRRSGFLPMARGTSGVRVPDEPSGRARIAEATTCQR